MEYSRVAERMRPSATLSITARAKAMAREGRDVVALSAGQPDFPSPRCAIEAAQRAMMEGKTGYTPAAGIPELREAVASSYSLRHGIEMDSGNVLISCGAKHSIANLLAAAVNRGDEVLIPRPYWVSYPEMVIKAGGEPVEAWSDEMLITPGDVRMAADRGIAGVILNSPGNPTGAVYGESRARELGAALAETGMWVISDDIYEDLVYGMPSAPSVLASTPELWSRGAFVTGVSKTYSMTGWRIGYAMANPEWIRLASTVQAHTTSNPTSISQWAALAVVEGGAEEERRSMQKAFEARRSLALALIEPIDELEPVNPAGAFYIFARVTRHPLAERTAEFCEALLEEEGLAIIPGSAFGAEGYIRLSFAASEDTIRKGIDKLGNFIRRGRKL
ncbi:MAG: pyridoxal phosphate-dependent aminotransferase [Candidatus Fermentibacteraceae bacterium]